MMDYKDQYKQDIGWGSLAIPYNEDRTALKRIREIYKTSRAGNISESKVDIIWRSILGPFFNGKDNLPSDQQSYDELILCMIKKIGRILGSDTVYKIGIGQKMFNLFMKDLWAWGELSEGQSKVLHFPLDRRILDKLREVPNTWKSWTKAEAGGDAIQSVWGDYLHIQKTFRQYFEKAGIFDFPIEMEQFFWHTIVFESFNVCPQHDFLNSPDLNKPVNLEIETIKSGTYTYVKYDNVRYYTRNKINIMGISCKGNFFTIKERIRKLLDLSRFEEVKFKGKDPNKYFRLQEGVGQNDCWHFYGYDQDNPNELIYLINQVTSLING